MKKIPPALQILTVWLLVVILGSALTMSRATAASTDDPDEPTLAPIGKSVLDDLGSALVTTQSVSQCGAGYFCVWPYANYQGTPKRYSAEGQKMSIPFSPVGSFYNNRVKRVFLYGDTPGSPICYAAGTKRSALSGWLAQADATYLSTATSC